MDSKNLISQFGIGFISTFIAAEKVHVCTKSEDDGFITFAINEVFKGFDYSGSIKSNYMNKLDTGTSIKVFLRREVEARYIPGIINEYCRHVKYLNYHFNGVLQQNSESWNVENGLLEYAIKNTKNVFGIVTNW